MAMHEDRIRYLMNEIKPYEDKELSKLLNQRAGFEENDLLKRVILFMGIVLMLCLIAIIKHV